MDVISRLPPIPGPNHIPLHVVYGIRFNFPPILLSFSKNISPTRVYTVFSFLFLIFRFIFFFRVCLIYSACKESFIHCTQSSLHSMPFQVISCQHLSLYCLPTFFSQIVFVSNVYVSNLIKFTAKMVHILLWTRLSGVVAASFGSIQSPS